MSLFALLLAPFVAGLLAGPLHRSAPRACGHVLACVPASMFAWLLWIGGTVPLEQSVEWVPSLGLSLTLRLDGFAFLFALLVTGIGTLVVIYANAHFATSDPERRGAFLALILLFASAMLGTVLSDDLLAMFVFWELTSLLSFFLIGFDSGRPEARRAALQSLMVTAGGGLALLAAILLIGTELGTFSLVEVTARSDELLQSPVALGAMVLILVGAFAKSAQVPFHFWLPNAMAAPSPASAFLHSATMVKLGIYILARFDTVFAGQPLFGTLLAAFGSATMLVAALRALSCDGYKAMLAQSTVGSLGILVMLIGLDGPVAALAFVGFLFAHALYKAAMFFCAGIAIHAAGLGDLSRLGGLARHLPWTAAAALLAAISMAGLPPTLGFVAKEYLFEGQLDSSYRWGPVVVAVLVNAVFVAVAAMAAWKPFFSKDARPSIAHGESAGLVAAPLVLGGLGLLFGIMPGLVASTLLLPAAAAVHGGPIPASFSLWHGWTTTLLLSALVVALGSALFAVWPRIQPRLGASRRLDAMLGDRGYETLFGGLLSLAKTTTQLLQNGDQHRYTAVTMAAVLALCVYGLLRSGAPLAFDPAGGRFDPATVAVLALMVASALAACLTLSLLRTMIAVGIVGFGSAAVFLLNGAPDLALTQFSVEVLVVVVLVALLLRVRDRAPRSRARAERGIDAALALGFGLVLFAGLAALVTLPLDLRLTQFFAQTSYTQAYGRNVVNVILVDYRALDTLGEIAVVGFSAIAVWGLLRTRGTGRGAPR